MGIFAVNAADGRARVLVGRRGHSARVQDDHFGFAGTVGALQSMLQQLPFDGRTVGLGRTASEVLHVIRCHNAIISTPSHCFCAARREGVASNQRGGAQTTLFGQQLCSGELASIETLPAVGLFVTEFP